MLILLIGIGGCADRTQAPEGRQNAEGQLSSPASEDSAESISTVPTKDDLFVDVSQEVGLDFVHFNGMSGAFYICEVKCAGGGLFDYDRHETSLDRPCLWTQVSKHARP